MSHHWNTYLAWLQREVDAAIVAHYDATIKVQDLRKKLHEARHEKVQDLRKKLAARNKYEAMKVATSNVINEK
jgi:hypothetical protein